MNPATQEIIGQILGIFATIITFLSYQMNTKKTLLIAATAAKAGVSKKEYMERKIS